MTAQHSNGSVRSRRRFLQGAVGVGGSVAATSFAGAFGIATMHPAASDVATILNLAATAEALAATFYHAVLTSATFHIADEDAEHLELALAAELHHLDVLRGLGGAPSVTRFHLPARTLSDASVFVGTALRAEGIFAGAYLAATHQFALLGQPLLAATAAQHGASEAQHLGLIAQLAGVRPSAATMPQPLFRDTAGSAAALAPFLKGGEGFTLAAQLPTTAQIDALLGDTLAVRALPFAEAYRGA